MTLELSPWARRVVGTRRDTLAAMVPYGARMEIVARSPIGPFTARLFRDGGSTVAVARDPMTAAVQVIRGAEDPPSLGSADAVTGTE